MQLNFENIDVQKILQGDMGEFESIYRMFFKPLVLFANKYVFDLDEAENVVQDVFLNFWINRHRLDPSKNIKTYLYTSVRNRSLNVIKHVKVKHDYIANLVINDLDVNTPEDQILLKEMEQTIQKALLKLPEKCRHIFLMSRIDRLTYAEISEILGISIKTVENQMGKALKILREQLSSALCLVLCVL